MKVSIEVDLTPAEFREALGLPDVKAAQERWLASIEGAVADEVAKLSPEAIAKQWSGALMPNADMLNAVVKMMSGGSKS